MDIAYLLISFAIGCTVLIGALVIGQRLVGYELPALGEVIWRSAVVMLVVTGVNYFIGFWLISLVVYFGMLAAVFRLDALESVVIMVVTWFINVAIIMMLFAAG